MGWFLAGAALIGCGFAPPSWGYGDMLLVGIGALLMLKGMLR